MLQDRDPTHHVAYICTLGVYPAYRKVAPPASDAHQGRQCASPSLVHSLRAPSLCQTAPSPRPAARSFLPTRRLRFQLCSSRPPALPCPPDRLSTRRARLLSLAAPHAFLGAGLGAVPSFARPRPALTTRARDRQHGLASRLLEQLVRHVESEQASPPRGRGGGEGEGGDLGLTCARRRASALRAMGGRPVHGQAGGGTGQMNVPPPPPPPPPHPPPPHPHHHHTTTHTHFPPVV